MPYKDPEANRAYKRLWNKKTREKNRASYNKKQQAWRAKNPNRYKQAKAAYRKEHTEKIQSYRRAYYLAHRQERIAKTSAWLKSHPDKRRKYVNTIQPRRRAQKRGAHVLNFSAAQWELLQAVFHHRCAYCGKRAKGKLTQDHITPLSKGGQHTLHNIVPACWPCNRAKGNRAVPRAVQPLLL